MTKIYRKGAVGALMDEYERATYEFLHVVDQTSNANYERIFDPNTRDENCRSIQTITSHVVNSGYGYANYIREQLSIAATLYVKRQLPHGEVRSKILAMLQYTIETLNEHWEMTEEEVERVVIQSRWGVRYDLEQMLEHAIVHVLRHRRQIERSLLTASS